MAGATGPTGATGPLTPGTLNQSLRYDGAQWLANSNLINTGSKIGIGTTSPLSKLDVSGDIRFGSSDVNSLHQAKIGMLNSYTYPQAFIQMPGNYIGGTSCMHNLNIYRAVDSIDDRWYRIAGWDSIPTVSIWDRTDPIQGFPHRKIVLSGYGIQATSRYNNFKELTLNPIGGNVGIGTKNPAASLEVAGSTRITDLAGIGDRIVVADADGDLSTRSLLSTSINTTNGGDVNLYYDTRIRLWLDDATTDDIELEIFGIPSVGNIHTLVIVGSTETFLDLSNPSNTTLDADFGNDEMMKLKIWMPETPSWGFYEITLIKTNSLYTSVPVLCNVVYTSL